MLITANILEAKDFLYFLLNKDKSVISFTKNLALSLHKKSFAIFYAMKSKE